MTLKNAQGPNLDQREGIEKVGSPRKHDYRVTRPFTYREKQYLKDQRIRAPKEDLTFLLKNGLIS